MTTDLVVAQADDDYRSAMRAMDQTNIRHLPVVSGDRLLSMLSIRDLMRVDLEDKGQEIRALCTSICTRCRPAAPVSPPGTSSALSRPSPKQHRTRGHSMARRS